MLSQLVSFVSFQILSRTTKQNKFFFLPVLHILGGVSLYDTNTRLVFIMCICFQMVFYFGFLTVT